MVESNNLSAVRFAESFIDCITEFVQDRPAWLNLVAAPISFHRAQSARKALRSTISDAFRSKNLVLSQERALLAANVAVHTVKGMATLWREAGRNHGITSRQSFERCSPRTCKGSYARESERNRSWCKSPLGALMTDGEVKDIAADKKVILVARAILMLSGVGEGNALRSPGIRVIENLPG